jgi:hypothetical protein
MFGGMLKIKANAARPILDVRIDPSLDLTNRIKFSWQYT